MPNQHIVQRLLGIQTILNGVHQAGIAQTAATKGAERAAFIDTFLAQTLTPQFRFGDGDVTDRSSNLSGQLDVVVEYPWVPSLPVAGSAKPRLYLAEGVAAAIEVKSDISAQWSDVLRTALKLSKLKRQYGGGMTAGIQPPEQIPLFAVGYTGWKGLDTVKSRLGDGPVAGILVIDAGIFVANSTFHNVTAQDPLALWGLLVCIHKLTCIVSSTSLGVPLSYAL